jgi:hypothetical protein
MINFERFKSVMEMYDVRSLNLHPIDTHKEMGEKKKKIDDEFLSIHRRLDRIDII